MDILARNDGLDMTPVPIIENNVNRNNEIESVLKNDACDAHDGFNTIIKCRWCCGDIKEVYIPKFKDGHDGKPVSLVFNYTPCKDCQAKWDDLIICIETTDKEPYTNCLPITYDDTKFDEKGNPVKIPMYPTGRYVGIYPESSESVFGKMGKDIKKGDVTYFDTIIFDKVFKNFFPTEN